MKTHEIRRSITRYQRAIEAFDKLMVEIRAAKASVDSASGRLPALGHAARCFERAERHLEVIGDAVAVVPELADELEAEQRISEMFRKTAAAHGISLRYDVDVSAV